MRSARGPIALAACLALLSSGVGCLAPQVAPLGAEVTTATLADDEAYLWKKTREVQHEIETSGLRYVDPALDAYLAQVVGRVAPASLREAGLAPRVAVISDVQIHGYSFANGVIYLHTALLSRMEDEDALATVLTRELAHVIDRHTLRLKREEKARADALAWLGVGATLSQAGSGAQMLAQAYSISSAIGFPHQLEVEADRKGLELLHAAGYDVRRTPAFFEGTIEYLAELHPQGPLAWLAFAPPAPMTARIAGYRSVIAERYPDPVASAGLVPPIADAKRFRRLVRGATERQAELELAAGLFLSAEKTARLACDAAESDPAPWLLLGRALQGQRDKPLPGRKLPSIGDVRAAYRQALAIDARNAPATRELGLTYYRTTGRVRTAKSAQTALQHLRRYLALAPEAQDADYVRAYIAELETDHP